MLRFIRKNADSVVVKVFVCVLAFTFILGFGITSIIDKLTNNDYVIRIGNIKILPDQFKQIKHNTLRSLKSRMGNTELDESLIDKGLIHKLIWENIVELAASDCGFIVDRETSRAYLHGISLFRDKNGVFNSQMFKDLLHKLNYSESLYLDLIKVEISAELLKAPVKQISVAHWSDIYALASAEQRKINIVEINPNLLPFTGDLSDDKLKSYYEANKNLFSINETRSVQVIEISEEIIKRGITVSEDEIKEAYDFSADKESTSFDDAKSDLKEQLLQEKLSTAINTLSRSIEDALSAGVSIEEIAKKHPVTIKTFDNFNSSGVLSKTQKRIACPYVEDLINMTFTMEENACSSFSEYSHKENGNIHWLVKVTSIVPEHVESFEKSKNQVITEYKKFKRNELAQEIAQSLQSDAETAKNLLDKAKNSKYRSSLSALVSPLFGRSGELSDKNFKLKHVISEIYDTAFTMDKKECKSRTIDDNIYVYQVADIKTPVSVTSDEQSKFSSQLKNEIVADVYQQMIRFWFTQYKVDVNTSKLNKVSTINEPIDII